MSRLLNINCDVHLNQNPKVRSMGTAFFNIYQMLVQQTLSKANLDSNGISTIPNELVAHLDKTPDQQCNESMIIRTQKYENCIYWTHT